MFSPVIWWIGSRMKRKRCADPTFLLHP